MDDDAKLRSLKFLRPGLSLLLLVLGLLPLSAAVRFDMFVGYDGLVPQGSWLPITFEVQNDDEQFVGTVEISPGPMTSGQERLMQVELPRGTTKRFTVPVFSSVTWNPTWFATLLDERRRVRAKADGSNIRRFNGALLPVVAGVTRTPPTLPEIKSRQDNMRPLFGRFQPALVPDNPLAFDGLDALYLASERALELKAGQVSAILSWLHAGGHLIISIEQPGHLAGPGAWLAELLPGTVSGLGTSSGHSALEQWVKGTQRINGGTYDFSQSNFQPRGINTAGNPFAHLAADPDFAATPLQTANFQLRPRDGRVLIGTDQQPLVVTAHRGLGRLTVLTFAPELEPFRSWKLAPYFWAKAVELAPELLVVEWPNRGANRPIESIFGAMIDSRQIRKLPVGWLLLLLVAYLLVIGPFDQWWLKKINRQMLTWITFPAYVAFFSLLIYFIGYKLRAGETEWTELHLVDVIPASVPAGAHEIRGRTYGSIYSPVNARYAFVNDIPNATFRGEYTGNYGNQDSARGQIEQRPGGVSGEMAVPVWTSQLFVSDWWKRMPSPVTFEVTPTEIRVANRLDQPLAAACVMLGDQILTLGDIPSGGTKSFARGSLTSTALNSVVSNHGTKFAGITSARQQVFSASEGGRINDWTNAVLAASFLQRLNRNQDRPDETFSAPRGFDLTDALNSGQAVLIAWAPGHAVIPSLNRFAARRAKHDTVFRVIAPTQANSTPKVPR